MKASLHSVRIAPKKANLIAKMVRGMTVPVAMEALRRTHKKGARLIEQLLRSAIANTSHNDKQDAQGMVIKTIVVNQGTAYQRGVPMARGRVRPMRKFLSHIDLVLGFPEVEDSPEEKKQKNQKKQKTESTAASKKSPTKKSSESSVSSSK